MTDNWTGKDACPTNSINFEDEEDENNLLYFKFHAKVYRAYVTINLDKNIIHISIKFELYI